MRQQLLPYVLQVLCTPSQPIPCSLACSPEGLVLAEELIQLLKYASAVFDQQSKLCLLSSAGSVED